MNEEPEELIEEFKNQPKPGITAGWVFGALIPIAGIFWAVWYFVR